METISVKKKFMEPVKLILTEGYSSKKPKKNKYSFTAVVLVWDPLMDYEWSIVSRNGVRYHRDYSVATFKRAIKHNSGIPFLYNHIMTDVDIEQLGLVTSVEDTGKELVVKGYLNGNKKRVLEEILPGFLNNVSLQVDGDRYEVEEAGEEVTYAKTTDVYEVSAVPVQGIPGANMFDIALCEAVKAAEANDFTDEEKKLIGLLKKESKEKIAALQGADKTQLQYYAEERNITVGAIDLDKMFTYLLVTLKDQVTVTTDTPNDQEKTEITINVNTNKEDATTSSVSGAIAPTIALGDDDEELMSEEVTVTKSEIEDELSNLTEDVSLDEMEEIYNEVLIDDQIDYDELKKEVANEAEEEEEYDKIMEEAVYEDEEELIEGVERNHDGLEDDKIIEAETEYERDARKEKHMMQESATGDRYRKDIESTFKAMTGKSGNALDREIEEFFERTDLNTPSQIARDLYRKYPNGKRDILSKTAVSINMLAKLQEGLKESLKEAYGLVLDEKVWEESLENFVLLYLRAPETAKDYARVSAIYARAGGRFEDDIIPKDVQDELMKEGVFDQVKSMLGKLFSSPILVGIAVYFLSNLYKKNKR